MLDGLLQLVVLAASQGHLVVSYLEAAEEMRSMRYCCFALALWAAVLEDCGRMLYSVLDLNGS